MTAFARVFAFLTGREPGAPNKTAAPIVARRASDAGRAVLPPRAREDRKRRRGATTKAGTEDGTDDESDGDDSEGVLSAFRQEQIDAEEQERARWRSRLQRVKAEAADIARELLELLDAEGFPIELFDNNDLAAVNEFAEWYDQYYWAKLEPKGHMKGDIRGSLLLTIMHFYTSEHFDHKGDAKTVRELLEVSGAPRSSPHTQGDGGGASLRARAFAAFRASPRARSSRADPRALRFTHASLLLSGMFVRAVGGVTQMSVVDWMKGYDNHEELSR